MFDLTDLTDLPDLPAMPYPRRETESPLRALHAAWLAAIAASEALPPGSDESLADAAYALVVRVEREIAAIVPETAEDFAIKIVVADVEPADFHAAALLRMARYVAGLGT
jgi:hypothetical protein